MIASVDFIEGIGARFQDGAYEYCRQVLTKKRPACRKIKLACRRHLCDLERSENDSEFGYYYDPEAADRVIRFAKLLKHWEGELSGEFFKPEPWQVFLLSAIFGWKQRTDNLRRFRYAYIEVPRKNGKSFLASVVALYMLVADKEDGAQVYAAATKRDQAKIVWGAAEKIAKKSGIKQITSHWLKLEVKQTDSRFEPLASDSETLDGLNPHCVVCDELHEWTDRTLWDVIEDAFGSRSQPLMFVITTAGHNKHGICFIQRLHATAILDAHDTQTYSDDTYFVFIADMDESYRKKPDGTTETYYDWKNETRWYESNPCLGAAKKLAYMRDQCHKASLMGSKLNTFLNKQLDIWTTVEKRWLDMDCWDACNKPVERVKLARQVCYSGLDLSSIQDLTANVLLFPPGPIYPEFTILPFFYLPEENLLEREKADKVPYRQWVDAGYIKLTPGNLIDLAFIKEDMLRFKKEFNIKEVGFDPWKAVEIATQLEQEGLKMIQMRQGHATLGPPSADLEHKVLKKMIRHGDNPVLRWMASNTSVIRDENDNIRPDKGGGEDGKGRAKKRNRIDGIVATVMALGLAIQSKGTGRSIYETRGPVVLRQ